MDSLEVTRSLDDVMRLVADRQRRMVLRSLIREPAHQSSIETLVDHLVAHSPANRRPSPETVRTQLHHKDLPALQQHGLIDYDPRTGDVRYHPDDRVEALLECLPDG